MTARRDAESRLDAAREAAAGRTGLASADVCLPNLQTIAQQESQLQYMRHSARSRDSEIEALTARWREFQDMQERWTSYERERVGERDALRKRGEQLEALKNKVSGWSWGLAGLGALCTLELLTRAVCGMR